MCELFAVKTMDNKEPYRATKLWNEVIMSFQSCMPLKKHRKKMHTYYDCFIASDAVTWLHCYLMNNPNFGHDVTRQQTINLLGKFLKCRVIESVTPKSKRVEFADNSQLYRFTSLSPQQFKTLPLRLVQSPSLHRSGSLCNKKDVKRPAKISSKNVPEFQKENIPECMFVEKKISITELGLVWKTATLARLENLLPGVSLNDILDEKSISGHVIKHNVCRISQTGVVSLIDKTDDIPHWVISAMKCLANWPNASGSGSCLPNYPGFEKDVFKVVRDFFINPQVPLLSEFLSSVMLTVFCHFFQDLLQPLCDFKNTSETQGNNLISPVPSVKDVKTSTPVTDTDKERFHQENTPLAEYSEGKLLLDDPEVMWDYPSTVYFETDFATSDPVTKVLPSHNNSNTMCHYDPLHGSIESISTISVCSINPDSIPMSKNQQTPTSPLKNWCSDPCLKEGKSSHLISQSLQIQTNTPVKSCMRQSHSMFDYLYIPYADTEDPLNSSICSSKTLTEEEAKMSLYEFHENKSNCVYSHNDQVFSSAMHQKNSSHLSQCSHVSENSRIRNYLKQFENISFPSELKSSFQLILLFLHPPNRRQLHLLFRVINKILKNQKFILDVKMPMRDYLLHTFLPAIVQSDVNQSVLFGMASFMLDNCEALFQPPSNLKEEVEELCKLRNGRIIYNVDDACFLTYCELVSKQQYEEQKVFVSTEALKSLLNSIILDKKLSDKERKRRIKQFKESHPDVYYELFPGKEDCLVKSKSTFLNKLASLRM